ncbi:MAG: hypothetical protein COZ06_27010, partial [Armatimonadetes bacterium CG_4_10_14_3_um_filter_66_18]
MRRGERAIDNCRLPICNCQLATPRFRLPPEVAMAARTQIRLEYLSGPEDGKIVGLSKDSITVGRAQDNDLAFPADSALSRRHARVFRDGERLFVEDAGSSHGTFLDGRRIEGRTELPPESLL